MSIIKDMGVKIRIVLLTIVALVTFTVEGICLYKAFILCNKRIECECIEVIKSESSPYVDAVYKATINGADCNWIETTTDTDIFVGDTYVVYTTKDLSGDFWVTPKDRNFLIGCFIVLVIFYIGVIVAVLKAIKYEERKLSE